MICHGLIPKPASFVRSWILLRHLCSVETKAALRPFYFAVHPDLFGQYPQQRIVNEDSLKRLNSYLESLEEKIPVNPTQLTFYLKNSGASSFVKGSETFKTVQFLLSSRDLDFTVSHILKSCGMLEDVVTVRDNGNKAHREKTTAIYNQFKNEQLYHVDLRSPQENDKYTYTLEEFLSKNIESVKERLENSSVLLRENENLSERVCVELNLRKLVSHSKWGLAAYQGSLRKFVQLCSTKKTEFLGLKGRTVVFTSCTAVDPIGRVMLGVQDVPEFWLSLINTLPDYDVLVGQVPHWERRVSRALGDMKIGYDAGSSPTVTVQEYLNHLHKSVMTLTRGRDNDSYQQLMAGDFKGLEGEILSPVDSLSLSPGGKFMIPSSTSAEHLVNFLYKHKHRAWELQEKEYRNSILEEQAVKECKAKFELQSLQKDECVSSVQMTECCKRLVEHLDLELQDTQLIVSTYYNVTTDGLVNIPWNWV